MCVDKLGLFLAGRLGSSTVPGSPAAAAFEATKTFTRHTLITNQRASPITKRRASLVEIQPGRMTDASLIKAEASIVTHAFRYL